MTLAQDKSMEHFVNLFNAFIATAIAATLNYFMPVGQFIAYTFCIVVADMFSGIQAAKKREEKIEVSKGMRRTAVKFTQYALAILAAHGLQNIYLKGFPMVFTISAFIAVTEFWSMLENVGTVTGTDILSAVKSKLLEIKTKEGGRN